MLVNQQKQVDELQQKVQELDNQIKCKHSFIESNDNKRSMRIKNNDLYVNQSKHVRSLSKNSNRKSSNDGSLRKSTKDVSLNEDPKMFGYRPKSPINR